MVWEGHGFSRADPMQHCEPWALAPEVSETMKRLTKIAIIATCAGLIASYSTQTYLALPADGSNRCIEYWHVPLYGMARLSGLGSRICNITFLLSLVIPPALWIVVGTRKLIFHIKRSNASTI